MVYKEETQEYVYLSFPVTQSCLAICDPMDCMWLAKLLCPWNSLGKNTGVGRHSLLQGIFPTWGLNLGLLDGGQILNRLSQLA